MQPIDAFATDGTTFVNPLGLVFTILMGILLLVLPRRYALLPIIALICYMTMGMRIMIGPLNFTMLRIVLPFGWLRLILRGELKEIRFNPIDKTMLAWVFVSIVTYTLLWQTGDAFKYKLGFAYDCLGFYFMFRYFVRDMDDVTRTLRMLAVEDGALAAPFDAAGIAGMPIEDAIRTLVAGQLDLLGIDHDDVVAAIHVRRVGRLVLAAQAHGDDRSESAQNQAVGVDQQFFGWHLSPPSMVCDFGEEAALPQGPHRRQYAPCASPARWNYRAEAGEIANRLEAGVVRRKSGDYFEFK